MPAEERDNPIAHKIVFTAKDSVQFTAKGCVLTRRCRQEVWELTALMEQRSLRSKIKQQQYTYREHENDGYKLDVSQTCHTDCSPHVAKLLASTTQHTATCVSCLVWSHRGQIVYKQRNGAAGLWGRISWRTHLERAHPERAKLAFFHAANFFIGCHV